MLRNINWKSAAIGAAAVVILVKFVAPRVSALQPLANKLS
jgi:hypothetical protein